MNRKEILTKAEEYICKDRNTSYGEPENNFQNIANLWNDYLFAKYEWCEIMSEDIGVLMALLKIARMASGNKEDNFIDAAGYIACAGEIATSDKAEEFEKFWNDCCGGLADIHLPSVEEEQKEQKQAWITPIILDGVVCTMPSKDEMDKFWHDVLTSNGDVD